MEKHLPAECEGTILIVDDSPVMQRHLQSMLGKVGYSTHVAATGREAYAMAAKHLPHLILLDVMLPDMSGYDVCQRLKLNEITADIPVVFVTGHSDVEERLRGLQLGALDYISKPIEKRILLTKAKTFVQLCSDSRKIQEMHSRLLDSLAELKRFSQALDNASDGVVLTDLKGEIIYYNSAFERLADINPDGVLNTDLHSFLSDPDMLDISFRNALKGIPSKDENQLRRKEENTVPIIVNCSAILDKNGKPTGLLTLLVDLTERKQAETERAKLEAELYQSHKLESVGQLAAGIAHEINTPVQFIGDNLRFMEDSLKDLLDLQEHEQKLLEACKQGAPDTALIKNVEDSIEMADVEYLAEELPRAIEQSIEGVQRVASIVLAMKEFAHPGSTERAMANLNENILTTITVARNKWKYCAHLETDLDDHLPMVPCLINEFNQVILNLIVNASDAIFERVGESGDMGNIWISTEKTEESAIIRIKDSGGGIPKSIQDKIFDPFFTTKEVGRGSGQGLAIARNVIVNKHHGDFGFETEPGVGTTFIIQLPLREAEEEEEEQEQHAGAA